LVAWPFRRECARAARRGRDAVPGKGGTVRFGRRMRRPRVGGHSKEGANFLMRPNFQISGASPARKRRPKRRRGRRTEEVAGARKREQRTLSDRDRGGRWVGRGGVRY